MYLDTSSKLAYTQQDPKGTKAQGREARLTSVRILPKDHATDSFLLMVNPGKVKGENTNVMCQVANSVWTQSYKRRYKSAAAGPALELPCVTVETLPMTLLTCKATNIKGYNTCG